MELNATSTHLRETSPGDGIPSDAMQPGAEDRAAAWLAMIRRYVRGAPAAGDVRITAEQCEERLADADRVFSRWLAPLRKSAAELVGTDPARIAAALTHMHHESHKLTMSGDALLDNVVELMRAALDERVPGDFVETGAWRGGITILMRATLRAYGNGAVDARRKVWVADSFAGLPAPDPDEDLRDAIWHHLMQAVGLLRSDLSRVQAAFARVGLLDSQVRFLPGWFANTLPAAPIERIALLRLDGDWYESTRDALNALYARVSPGGYVIVDDYGLPTGCARAVDEYRAAHRIDAPLVKINAQAVWWRKP